MANSPTARERGDTFIEVLVALLIISIAVVGLLGGLLTSTAGSVTHRSLASLDNVLRSVASSIQSAVSGPPGSNPSSPLLYQSCLNGSSPTPFQPYEVAGPLYPSTQAVGGPVSVAVIGLKPTTSLTAKIGAAAPVPAGTTSTSGAAIATFNIPAGLSGLQTVTLSDGTSPTIAAPSVNVANPGNSDALLGHFSLSSSLAYWSGASFVVPTTPSCSNLQKLTLTLSRTDSGNGASDSVDAVLEATNELAVPTESVASSITSPKPLGTNFNFTASVSGTPTTPSGQVTWTFQGAPAGTVCSGANPSTLAGGTTSCAVGNSTEGFGCTVPAVGSYTAAAAYGGDSNWTGTSSETTSTGAVDTVVISQGTSSVTTSTTSPNPAQIGGTITFKATALGSSCIVPTGSVTWTFPGAPLGSACSGGNTTPLSNGTATCSVSPALPGTYKPVATYSGDANYTGSSGNQASVTASIPASSTTTVNGSPNNPGIGSTLTFTATVGGVPGLTATGTVTWSFSPSSPAGATCSNLSGNAGPLNGSGQATCTVTNAVVGTYAVTANYGGDSHYSSSLGSASLTVGKAIPTVSVSGSVTSNKGLRTLTFTATIQPPGATATPAGTVSWTITVSGGNQVSCTSNPTTVAPGAGNSGTATCTISGNSSKSITYTATANYSGDSNYATASGTGSSPG